eukprot:CAMPEP_0174301658 /NCGR_PEP_ID=MMETSP0809-20121228/59172_1 /TAXON_ID=73025 ORGANISM="Eutreptiella gymnastica-like, Strain CCMP1594" /NCGR_SAMPLE_ID=MMETSP0809 /ASSEMBLY_ACC=CAM_ASM_000658 /LENGTH=185 /DNA_ID=CAMNT_0015407441 /DNA_START=1494 /DNA_END=2052 /DNA_ORIENTATION=+
MVPVATDVPATEHVKVNTADVASGSLFPRVLLQHTCTAEPSKGQHFEGLEGPLAQVFVRVRCARAARAPQTLPLQEEPSVEHQRLEPQQARALCDDLSTHSLDTRWAQGAVFSNEYYERVVIRPGVHTLHNVLLQTAGRLAGLCCVHSAMHCFSARRPPVPQPALVPSAAHVHPHFVLHGFTTIP